MTADLESLKRQRINIPQLLRALTEAAEEAMESSDISAISLLTEILAGAVTQLQRETDFIATSVADVPVTPAVSLQHVSERDTCASSGVQASETSYPAVPQRMEQDETEQAPSTPAHDLHTDSVPPRVTTSNPDTPPVRRQSKARKRDTRVPAFAVPSSICTESGSVTESTTPEKSASGRKVRPGKMPLSPHTGTYRPTPTLPLQGERDIVPTLQFPVPTMKLHELNTSSQIRKVASLLSVQDTEADDGESDSSSTISTVSQSKRRKTSPEQKSTEIDLFLMVAADWPVLPRTLFSFHFTPPSLPPTTEIDKAACLVQQMLNLHHGVDNYAMRELGSMLSTWNRQDPTFLKSLSHHAANMKCRLYHLRLSECGCEQCKVSFLWEQDRTSLEGRFVSTGHAAVYDEKRRPGVCAKTQLRIDELNSRFSGFSVTNLKRIQTFSEDLISGEGATTVTVPMTKVVTSTTEFLAAAIKRNRRQVANAIPAYRSIDHVGPPGVMVEVDKFLIQVQDGDGVNVPRASIIQLAHVNGLPHPFAANEDNGRENMEDDEQSDENYMGEGQNEERIRCRLAFVDASEMNDVFVHRSWSNERKAWSRIRKFEAGLQSLRHVRCLIYKADTVYLSLPLNVGDRSLQSLPKAAYDRFEVDVWCGYTERPCQLSSVSLSQLTAGLAVVDEAYNSPTAALALECEARQKRLGIFQFAAETTGKDSIFMHWVSRKWRTIDKKQGNPTEDIGDGTSIEIAVSSYRHESLVFVDNCTVPNAGKGLFLMPRKYEIEKGTHLCEYASVRYCSLTAVPTRSLDYVLEVDTGEYFDAEIFDYVNLGRFVNDLSVQETIKFAVENGRKDVMAYFPYEDVMKRYRSTATVTYHASGTGNNRKLYVVTSKTIPPGGTMELSANYGLLNYWFHGVAASPARFQPTIADPIIWLLLSDHSNLSKAERIDFSNKIWTQHDGLTTLSKDICDRYMAATVPPGLNTQAFLDTA